MSSDSPSAPPIPPMEMKDAAAVFKIFAANQRANMDPVRALRDRRQPEKVNIEDLKMFADTFKLHPLASTTTVEQELARIAQHQPPQASQLLGTSESVTTEDEEEEENPSVPKGMEWVIENKFRILAIHSSGEYTSVFALQCGLCQRWFKHCMFSNAQRKEDDPLCHWCQVDCWRVEANQFQVHHHIWCNKPGKKRCGQNCTLETPKEASMDDVQAPEVVYTIKKKMSQKERKAAARAMAEQLESGL